MLPRTIRRINATTHIAVPKFVDVLRLSGLKDIADRTMGMPTMYNIENRLRAMVEHEDTGQVISHPLPSFELLALKLNKPAEEIVKPCNDQLADLCAKHPQFIAWFGSLPMDDPAAAVKEMERIIKMGGRGFQINAHVLGKPLDLPEYRQIFAKAAALGFPIFIHPCRDATWSTYPSEREAKNEEWWIWGWEDDLLYAQGRIIFAGIFDEFPSIKIIIHHFKGGAGAYAGRSGQGWQYGGGKRTSGEPGKELARKIAGMRMRPEDYLHMFYADTAGMGGFPGTVCGIRRTF